jgi:hypothetical protein
VRAEQYSKSLPKYAFSLDIRDLMSKVHHAPGMGDWTVFRQSLTDELPHFWGSTADTAMRMAHFVRRHFGARAGQQVDKSDISRPAKKNGDGGASFKVVAEKRSLQKQHDEISSGKGRNGKTALSRTLSAGGDHGT